MFLNVVLYFAGPDLVSYIKELILMEKTYSLRFLDAKPCIIIWQLCQKVFLNPSNLSDFVNFRLSHPFYPRLSASEYALFAFQCNNTIAHTAQ